MCKKLSNGQNKNFVWGNKNQNKTTYTKTQKKHLVSKQTYGKL